MSTIKLSKLERAALSRMARSRAGRAEDARRARVILMLEAGDTHAEIRHKLSCSDAYIRSSRKRFEAEGVAGLRSRHAARRSERLEGRASSYVSDLMKKEIDIAGLYLHPTQHAAFLCVADRSATLTANPTGSRPGILSLYNAFNTRTTELLGPPTVRHTSPDFLAFLTQVVAHQPPGKELHLLADNISAHKTLQINDLLGVNCNVHLHFARSYQSWLIQVALCFSAMERSIGLLPSAPDLAITLTRHIRRVNAEFSTMTWKYVDPYRFPSKVTIH